VFYWRGPSPFYFVAVGVENAERIRERAAQVSYGWGMIPVDVACGAYSFTTSLFAKDGDYFLPLRVAVRKALALDEGDTATLRFDLIDPSH
jgi:hypothetical protein